MSSKIKVLKKGFTTGAAAAAAVKAALLTLCAKKPDRVEITFLTGEKKSVPVDSIEQTAQQSCKAIVIKDAGDDPDITHKAAIGARVTLSETKNIIINISGGHGVGIITKPGLELPVGEPAINPGPRTMIQNAVKDVFNTFNIQNRQVDIQIFVPKGEVLAKKTLNARLGIMGGISILGTTGVVTPMSHDAYIATIKSSISVAAARGLNTLAFTTGRRSERFAMVMFKEMKEEAFIQTGDFFKASLDMVLLRPEIETIIYTIFFGKAVKMALGFEHTHAAKSKLTLNKVGEWAREITRNKELAKQIINANTARHAFGFIHPQHPKLLEFIGNKIIKSAKNFSDHRLKIRVVIFDFHGNTAYDSINIS